MSKYIPLKIPTGRNSIPAVSKNMFRPSKLKDKRFDPKEQHLKKKMILGSYKTKEESGCNPYKWTYNPTYKLVWAHFVVPMYFILFVDIPSIKPTKFRGTVQSSPGPQAVCQLHF